MVLNHVHHICCGKERHVGNLPHRTKICKKKFKMFLFTWCYIAKITVGHRFMPFLLWNTRGLMHEILARVGPSATPTAAASAPAAPALSGKSSRRSFCCLAIQAICTLCFYYYMLETAYILEKV